MQRKLDAPSAPHALLVVVLCALTSDDDSGDTWSAMLLTLFGYEPREYT